MVEEIPEEKITEKFILKKNDNIQKISEKEKIETQLQQKISTIVKATAIDSRVSRYCIFRYFIEKFKILLYFQTR